MPASSFVCMRALESDCGGMPAGCPRSRAVDAYLSGRHGIRLDYSTKGLMRKASRRAKKRRTRRPGEPPGRQAAIESQDSSFPLLAERAGRSGIGGQVNLAGDVTCHAPN